MSNIRYFEEYREQILEILGQESVPSDIRNFEKWRFKVLTGLKDQATAEALGSSIRSSDVYREEVLKALDVSDYTRDDIVNEKKWRAKVLDAMGQEYTTADINYFERWRQKVTVGLDDFAGGVWKTVSGSIASFDDALAKPMKSVIAQIEAKQEGSGDPSPENVRPISGWSGVNVGQSGKNLFDMSDLIQGTLDGLVSDNNVSTNNYISIKGGAQYTLTTPMMDGRYIRFYDESKTEITGTRITWYDGRLSHTFTTPNNAVYMRFMWFSTSAITVAEIIASESQIELGSTATAYEPYQGTSYPISLGQTVYGGTLEVMSGKLVIDSEYHLLNGTEAYIYDLPSIGGCYYYPGMKNGTCLEGWCDIAPTKVQNVSSGFGIRFGIFNTAIYLDHFYEALGVTDLASFKTYLASHPIQLVYPIQTPTEIDLTPTEVKTLLGDNNIWADTGDVEVTYKAEKGGDE